MPGLPAIPASRSAASPRTVVIGAGISGIACARRLRESGCCVTVVDRGNRPGGRLGSRSAGDGPRIDYGAPFFEATTGAFSAVVEEWVAAKTCAPWRPVAAAWDGRTLRRLDASTVYVGMPDMGALVAWLANGLDIESATLASAIDRIGDGWEVRVTARAGDGPSRVIRADWVVIATPPMQAERVLGSRLGEYAASLARVVMQPSWMLAVRARRPAEDFPAVIDAPGHPVIGRLVRDDAKPGRAIIGDVACRWLVHAADAWSMDRFAADPAHVQAELMREAGGLLTQMLGGDALVEPIAKAHRWGLARARQWLEEPCVINRAERLVLCGDGHGGSGVGAAYLSGCSAADCIIRHAGATR